MAYYSAGRMLVMPESATSVNQTGIPVKFSWDQDNPILSQIICTSGCSSMNLYVVFCVVPFVIPMFRQKERENSSAMLHHNDPFIRFLFLYTQQYNVYVRHNTFSRNNSIISFKFYASVSTFDFVLGLVGMGGRISRPGRERGRSVLVLRPDLTK